MFDYDLHRIRGLIVVALFSVDSLLEQLVLKGGNALELIHGVAKRGSLDLDFSMRSYFEAPVEAGREIERALTRHLRSSELVVIDFKFADLQDRLQQVRVLRRRTADGSR